LVSADTLSPRMTVEASLAQAEAAIRRIVTDGYDRPSLVTTIAVKVGAEIIEGIRPAGSDLNSVELARLFKTSRTPIREALLLLEKQGLILIPPRRRPSVSTYDLRQIREIYNVRARLLEMSAADIAEYATSEGIARLRLAVSAMRRARHDVRAYFWCNVAFHDHMTAVSGNQLAKSIIESLLLRTLPLRRISLSQPGRINASLDDHVRLIRALEERDVALASALVRSNHRTALTTVELALDDSSAPRDDINTSALLRAS
jgi:DNA-binding GntR family transcriptional regulator